MNKKQKTQHNSKAKRGAIDLYAAQCSQCDKWRIITSQEEYEDLRCRFLEEPFTCDRKPNVTCDDPADVERDATRTWVIDKPNLPKTPKGFKRELIVRSDYSKLDAYYVTATGKRLRCHREVKQYLEKHTEYKHLKLEDFDFSVPKVMDETIPAQIKVKRVEKSGSKGKV